MSVVDTLNLDELVPTLNSSGGHFIISYADDVTKQWLTSKMALWKPWFAADLNHNEHDGKC